MSFGRARHRRTAGRGKNSIAMDRKKELLAKLEQIQDQAQLTLDELPLRLAKDRLRLIIGLARYLQTAVDLNWEEVSPAAASGDEQPPAARPV
jgi:hypothetical protein